MKIVKLNTIEDSRGALTSIEGGIDIPFNIERCYVIHHILAARGGHAHPDTRQLVFSTSGKIRIDLSNGADSKTFLLDHPAIGLLIEPMTWIEMPEFGENSVLVVLANSHYDHNKTIRDREKYLKLMGVAVR